MADVFCRNCGHNVEKNDNFCTKCGSKCEAKEENDGVEVLNFSMFKTKKEEKRRSFFGQKKRKTTTTSEESEVKINVGVISENSKGNLSKERGSRIPLKVKPTATCQEVLSAAVKKLGDNNQYFCSLDDYTLCYPDGKAVDKVPGTDRPFIVKEYKRELGKPFSKIYLFVCLTVHLQGEEPGEPVDLTVDFTDDDDFEQLPSIFRS